MSEVPFFESGYFRTPEEAARLIRVPENSQQIPQILGYVSPARSGSTAFGVLMAGHPKVDRSYFQPWKFALRHGGVTTINPQDRSIVMKDTVGPIHQEEIFDPLGILLRAGIPEEKITFIFGLRNPVNATASLEHFVPKGMDVDYFARMQEYTIELFNYYRTSMGERIIPFSFDLLEQGEEKVLKALLRKTGLELDKGLNLKFNREALGLDRNWRIDPKAKGSKMVWGEANNPIYFNEAVYPTVRRGSLCYVGGTTGTSVILSEEKRDRVVQLCQDDFNAFHQLARKELGL